MSLRFRKSINLGKGFRINFNKKSVGVSFGTKGARMSINSKVRVTRSVGIPGTGLYDVKTTNLNKSTNKSNNTTEHSGNIPQSTTPSISNNNAPNRKPSLIERIFNHVPGYRTRTDKNMVIATVYYMLTLIMAVFMTDLFMFALVMMWSVPFVVFSVIDTIKSKEAKKIIPVPICLFLLISSAMSVEVAPTPEEIHLNNQEILFEDINQEKSISYNVVPQNADKTNIELISSDADIAFFEGDTLHSKSEGETTIYAALKNSDTKSEEIHVVVKDKEAEAKRAEEQAKREAEEKAKKEAEEKARKEAEEQAKREAEEKAKQEAEEKVRQEAEQKAKQEAEEQAKQQAASKAAEQPKTESKNTSVNESSSSETVYIGNTGNKYHRASCSTLKGGGHAISLSEALKQGREPCKRCKP